MCPGEEFNVEMALREALGMPLCTAIRTSKSKSTHPMPLLARQGNIHRRDGQGKGFDVGRLGITDSDWT